MQQQLKVASLHPNPPNFATLPKPQPQEDAPVVDFWCGGGGVGTAGFYQAGFQIGVNIDCDPKNPKLSGAIADCYELNFGKPVVRETLQDYAARGGFAEQPKPDVVVFTQSCKNLSRANTGASEDDTDIAVAQAACQGITELLPNVFVLENVREYKDSICLELIVNTLDQYGYRYSHAVLNAWNYGISQDRERFILIAVRGYSDLVTLPFPSHSQPLGWGYAIADLISTFPLTQPAPWQLKGLLGVELTDTALVAGGDASSDVPKNRSTTQPSFTIGNCAARPLRICLVERTGARDKVPQVRESDRPAWTVKASVFTDQKNANRQDAINTWDGNGEWRRVTGRGVARLMGLYDWYQLPDAPSICGPLLGNGLPSEMARAIGEHIKQYLEINKMQSAPVAAKNQTQAIERYIEQRIESPSDPRETEDRLEFIGPLEINLERGSQTRVSKNAKGVKELKEKMESGVWRFDDPSDCPILIELTEDYLVKRQRQEPFWVRQGELIPAIGHTRIESGQELQQLKPELRMLCRIRKGTWFDVIQLGGTSDIESAHPKTTSDRTYACTRLIELLFERYGSLEAIPMRGRGKAGADLEEEWGTAKLSKMFGISPNTVTKLYQLVELNTQIADYPDGTRVQLIENSEFPLPWFLKNLVGALGVVSGSAPKEGLFVSFDQYNPEYVHPRFLQKSDAPLLVAPTKLASQHSSTKSELKEQARSLGIRPGAQSLPSSTSNLDVPPEELQAEPITPTSLNKEEETEVSPSQNHSILPIPTTSNGRIPETYNFAAKTDINLREATRVVVDNLHRLTADELLALEEAIAQVKASWSQEAAA